MEDRQRKAMFVRMNKGGKKCYINPYSGRVGLTVSEILKYGEKEFPPFVEESKRRKIIEKFEREREPHLLYMRRKYIKNYG